MTQAGLKWVGEASSEQLIRLWGRIMRRVVGDGGHFGWDWPTLRMTFPDVADTLIVIGRALDGKRPV